MLRKKKLAILFLLLGLTYLNIEVIFRGFEGTMVGFNGLKYASLGGWASLWIFPIGGFIGLVLGLFNESKTLRQIPIIIQSLIGTFFILLIEFLAGCILNIALKLHCWDYSHMWGNLLGQICVLFGVVWFFLCPFAFWLDDVLRYMLYREGSLYSLWSVYKKFFTFK